MTLRSAFELAATREQRSRIGGIPIGGNDGFGATDAVRGLEFLGSGTQDPSDNCGFSRPNYGQHGGIRNSLTQEAAMTGTPHGTSSNSSSPIDWYRNCLIEALRTYPAQGASSSGDQNVAVSFVAYF